MVTWHPDIPEEYRNQIVTGDAISVMAHLPSESIGLIITSPPYNIGLNYIGYDDNLSADEFRNFNFKWLSIAYRICIDGARMYVVVSDQMLWWFRDLAEKAMWTFAQKLVWCKPNLCGKGGRKISEDWNFMTEDILLFRKGKRTPMQSGLSTTHNWFVETVPQSNFKEGRDHPAQWPLNLPLRILSRTPGEPVLDMFVGSGQALRAAKILGRKYIGIELVEDVAELARKRVRETQPPLFVPEPEQLDLI